MKDYYVKIYLKRNAKLIAFMAFPVSALFFVISILYDAVSNDILYALIPFIIGFFAFGYTCIFAVRFNKMIETQEKMFNIKFDDSNAKLISKASFIYLSNDWLINAGSCAFYRDYVKSFSVKKYNSNRIGGGHRIVVNTIDGKQFEFHSRVSSDIKKFREWKNKK